MTIRQKAEAIWEKEYAALSLDADPTLPAMLQELQIHQIELELQNDELRATQQHLTEIQKRYFDLYNFAPVGYFTFDKQGVVVNVNLTGAQMLNREKRFLINRPFLTYLSQACRTIFFQHLDDVLTRESKERCELTLQRKGDTPIYVQVDSIPQSFEGYWFCHSTLTDITDRKQVEKALQIALKEKEILLKEVHHRVKNNLQIINSLLSLQSGNIDDPTLATPFLESQRRVKAMSLIHEQLYYSNNLARIEFGPYIEKLTTTLLGTYVEYGKEIKLEMSVDTVDLAVDVAIPCGLIVNEIVANALKYAFPGRNSGTIRVDFRALGSKKHQLLISDDGIGLSNKIINPNTQSLILSKLPPSALGLQLVFALAEQLNGQAEVRSNDGTEVRITF